MISFDMLEYKNISLKPHHNVRVFEQWKETLTCYQSHPEYSKVFEEKGAKYHDMLFYSKFYRSQVGV